MIRVGIILSFLLLIMPGAFPQSKPAFKHYDVKGVASKSILTSVYQDADRFLWFGGLTGLYKYDGNILTRFQHKPTDSLSIPHNYITDFYDDGKGYLICGTLGGGIFIVNKNTGKCIKPKVPEDLPEIGSNSIISLIAPSLDKSHIWIGTNPGTLIRYDIASGKFERQFSVLPKFSITDRLAVKSILELKPDVLLVATLRGLYYVDANNKQSVPLSAINSSLGHLDTMQIHSMFQDRENRIWIGYKGGVSVIDKESFNLVNPIGSKLAKFPSALTVKAIALLKDGLVLFGTNKGIYSWNEGNDSVESVPSKEIGKDNAEPNVNRFHNDNSGNLWLVTEGQGLYLLNKDFDFFKTVPGLKQLVKGAKLLGILEDASGRWWFGSESGVTYYKKDEKGSPRTLKEINSAINAIFQDSKGGLWFGSKNDGLYHFPDSAKMSLYELIKDIPGDSQRVSFGEIMSINEDRFGNIWVGTYTNGIVIMDIAGKRNVHYKNINDNSGAAKGGTAVSQIIRDKSGEIWISTLTKGINKFNPSANNALQGTFTNYTTIPGNPNSLSFFITLGMKEDADSNLWIGTVSAGLNKFEQTNEKFTRFSIDNGLPSNMIYRVEADLIGNTWVSTDEGISMISRSTGTPVNFKEEDGLPTRSFNFLASYSMRDGTIAFGTIDGDVVYFQPDVIAKNEQAPIIADFKLFNRSVSMGELDIFYRPVSLSDTFHLRHDQSVFTFEFSNFDFINPDSYTFAYMLEGIEKDWNYISNRKSATYTNLSPGTYQLHLKAANHLGVWSDKETIRWIIVAPPWWRTWWAYALYAILFVTAVWLFIVYRSRQLKRENRVLEEKVSRRTSQLNQSLADLKSTQSQLIHSEKMASLGELTAGIAHEIQNPLNFVNNFSEINAELINEMQNELKAGKTSEAIVIANDIKDNQEKINHHGKRADAIVKGMLQHSRTSTGVKEPTDLNALTDEYLRLAYHGLKAKDKSFNAIMKTEFDPSISMVSVIPQDIGRVILNLFTNAFYAVAEKARSSGGEYEPTVYVSTKKLNRKVEIKVRDNGFGIPQKVLDKIFQPFFTTKPTGQGTGLGLSLSYDIIKAHGGELKVESEEGNGAVFCIFIPL